MCRRETKKAFRRFPGFKTKSQLLAWTCRLFFFCEGLFFPGCNNESLFFFTLCDLRVWHVTKIFVNLRLAYPSNGKRQIQVWKFLKLKNEQTKTTHFGADITDSRRQGRNLVTRKKVTSTVFRNSGYFLARRSYPSVFQKTRVHKQRIPSTPKR